MKGLVKYLVIINCLSTYFLAQNENKKWYFGGNAGLDFMTNPPTILSNSSMSVNEGCSSISDSNGSLLFYTDGVTIWNQSHMVMANGTSLFGGSTSSQSSLIIKQPNQANIYYVFTLQGGGGGGGLRYSIVDMSLALGQGSVTIKNATLYPSPCLEKLTNTIHCNGVDNWIVIHEYQSNNFRSFLLTSAGINTTAVVSSVGANYNTGGYLFGCMKLSPNGKKIGLAFSDLINQVHLFDFDNSTGVITNPLILGPCPFPYGCEFSPDGTKLYAASWNMFLNTQWNLYQWNLCAVSNSAIISSQFAISTSSIVALGSLQLAPDGKIYVARKNQTMLGVISNPNALGNLCNYSDLGQSISPGVSKDGLPNFGTFHFVQPPGPFSYTSNIALSCNSATFEIPQICTAAGTTVNSVSWNFGDPGSGIANTSNLFSPVHIYPGPGSYTVGLVINYACRSDTILQPVIITSPTIGVTTTSSNCAGIGSATVLTVGGSGSYSYTWTPSAQTSSVANNLSAGLYTLTMLDNGGGCVGTTTLLIVPVFSLNVTNSQSLACNSVPIATAGISITNGSGLYSYNWSGTAVTASVVSGLAAGLHTVIVSDLINLCSITNTFLIAQPSALTLNIVSSSATACVGSSVVLSGTTQGGISGYFYNWVNGPASNSIIVNEAIGGNYVYTLNSIDANTCAVTNTISVIFVSNPILSVFNVSICPTEVATLTATGATTYTWYPNLIGGSSFTQSPATSQQYTLVGALLSCTSAAIASIILKPVPSVTLGSNSPICSNQMLNFYSSGGTSFVWNGPVNYISAAQNPTIYPVSTNQSGLYTLTVTAANSCTAGASVNVTINPTPTLSVFGSTVCSNQSMSLSANSFSGSSYYWLGPGSFTSNSQYPVVSNINSTLSGIYHVTVTSLMNCSNTGVADVTITTLPTIFISANNPLCAGTNLFLSGGGGSIYNWSGPNSFTSSIQSPSINNVGFMNAGTYTLTAITGPCIVNSVQTISINPIPSPIVNYNAPLCDQHTLQLYANSGYSYSWSGPQNFSSSIQNPSISVVSFSNAGSYSLTMSDANGCMGVAVVLVDVLENPLPAANGATVCLGGNVTINASGGVHYSWSGPQGFSSNLSSVHISQVNLSQTGLYTVVVTGSNSCYSSTVAQVLGFNYPLPTPTIVATPSVCLNSTISLLASGGLFYSWTGPGNFTSISNNINFIANNLEMAGIYSLSVINGSYCVGSGTVYIHVFPLPSANLSSSQNELCVPFCSVFKLNPSDNTTPLQSYTYFIEGNWFQSEKVNYCIQKEGTQIIYANYTDTHSCSNSSTLAVRGFPKPLAEFEYYPTKPIAGIDQVHFRSHSGGSSLKEWTWVFPNLDSALGEQSTFLFEEAGKFPVVLLVENEWSCKDTLIRVVTVEEEFALYVPNVFTPNNDGLNDLFRPMGVGLKDYNLEIYDRWGIAMFKTRDFLQGWDGYFNGSLCQQDIFTWKIIYTTSAGQYSEKIGHVFLQR